MKEIPYNNAHPEKLIGIMVVSNVLICQSISPVGNSRKGRACCTRIASLPFLQWLHASKEMGKCSEPRQPAIAWFQALGACFVCSERITNLENYNEP